MSVAAAWMVSAYQRITSARVEDGALVIRFGDGACANVAVGRLLPPAATGPDWSRMQVRPYELAVPTANGEAVISWATIRAISDPAYAEHLARAAEEQARTVGRRLRTFRTARGVTLEALAERARLDLDDVGAIEDGRQGVPLTTVRRLVEALGGSLRDLADPA